jgi:hypothetical protein
VPPAPIVVPSSPFALCFFMATGAGGYEVATAAFRRFVSRMGTGAGGYEAGDVGVVGGYRQRVENSR